MDKKIAIGIIVIIIAIIVVGAVWISGENNNIAQPRACTMEAKICPDGSAVGRIGPNCEFAACPALEREVINSCPTRPRVCANGTTVCREKKESCPEDLSDCAKEGEYLRNASLGPNVPENNAKPMVCCDDLKPIVSNNSPGNPLEGAAAICRKIDDQISSWQVYWSERYGFMLTFPETWKGYTAVYRQLDWGSDGKSDSIDFGFPAQKDGLFNISFYSEKQYNSIANSGVPFGMLLGKNADYVFVWNQTQYAANKDMEKRITEIQSIIKTFKLTK